MSAPAEVAVAEAVVVVDMGGARLSKSGREASTSSIWGRVMREGLMASMSVTAAARCCWWGTCIGEAHLVLLSLLFDDALQVAVAIPPVRDADKAGRSACP